MDEQNQAAPAPVAPVSAATPTPQAALSNVPDSWPGAFGLYKYSKQAVLVNLRSLVVVWIIQIVIYILFLLFLRGGGGSLIEAFIMAPFSAAVALILIASIRGQRMSPGEALSKGVRLWIKMFLAGLIIGFLMIASLAVLIVPFFFVAPRLVLTYYFLVDRKMGPIKATQASWDATRGHVGRVWSVIGANVLMALLAITVIGIPFAIYFLLMYNAAYVVMYEMMKDTQPSTMTGSAGSAPVPPQTPAATPPTTPVQPAPTPTA